MRPRPDAAENIGPAAASAADALASMRPRPDAAENSDGTSGRAVSLDWASMRPRPDAAENNRPSKSTSPASPLQ